MNPNAPTLLGLDDVHGVYADAIVHHQETGSLLFGSFWGRDTAMQELLARLSLGLAEGGLAALRLTDPENRERTLRVLIDAPDQLAKLSGRMPAANLFGQVVHLWLYQTIAINPDYAGRRALRLVKADAELGTTPAPYQQRDAAFKSDGVWALFKEISHLPLLDPWRQPVLEMAILHGWLRFHVGIGVNALEINLGTERYETSIGEMIQDGTLRIAGEARGSASPDPVVGNAGGSAELPPGDSDPEPFDTRAFDTSEGNRRLTANELDCHLRHFTGTEQWFRHSFVRSMLYTEGVQFFAEQGGQEGAYWFLDIVATEYFTMLSKEPFLVIRLIVENQEASIRVDDGNDRVLKEKSIVFTDMQPGDWKFYLTDNVLLLPGEY